MKTRTTGGAKREYFLSWFLLLLVLPKNISSAAINTNAVTNDGGVTATARTGEEQEDTLVKGKPGRNFFKPEKKKNEQMVTVNLEIGGLHLHWNDAGISWRIDPSALPGHEGQEGGREVNKHGSGEFPSEANNEKGRKFPWRKLEYNSRKRSARSHALGIIAAATGDDAFIPNRPPSPLGRASAFPSSDRIQHRIVNQDGTHVVFKFKLPPRQQFRLILETSTVPRKQDLRRNSAEGASATATTKNILTAVEVSINDRLQGGTAAGFVSVTMGDGISLLYAEGVDLLSSGMAHTFEDISTSYYLQNNAYRHLENKNNQNAANKNTTGVDKNPSPIQPTKPQTSPAPTVAPAVAGGTRPPSLTYAPSQSGTCISPTVSLDDNELYWAIRLARSSNDTGESTDADLRVLLDPVLTGLVEAYNANATCEQEGAYRTMTQAELVEIHRGGTTSSEVEVIVRLSGSCVGCLSVPRIELFSRRRAQDQPAAVNDTASGNRRELADAPPCVCPGPTRSEFIEEYNSRNPANGLGPLLNVTDLERLANCTIDGAGAADEPVQNHTASVRVVLSRDPDQAGAGVSPEEKKAIIDNFEDSFHRLGSFTERTCDLARRRIVSVLPYDTTNTVQRYRRLFDMPAQTSDDVELYLQVTFECNGCDGQLFGQVDVRNTTSCLCPVGTRQKGVKDQGLIGPLTKALRNVTLDSGGTLDIELSQVVPDMGLAATTQVADVMQVKEVSCGSNPIYFNQYVSVEYVLKANTIASISENDTALLETQFVKGYNGLTRRYCDPYFRQLLRAEVKAFDFSKDGTKASFEILLTGQCAGGCNATFPVYDPEAFYRNNTDKTFIRERKLLPWKPNKHQGLRRLQLESPTCYCSVTSSEDLGPSEPEVIQNYGALVDRLELETISKVSECKFLTTFSSGVLWSNISGSNYTEEELDQIRQTVLDTYENQTRAILEGDGCDPLFRQVTNVSVVTNPKEIVFFESTGQTNRKLWARIISEHERRAQLSTLAPSLPPSMSPTVDVVGVDLGLDLTLPTSVPSSPVSSENAVLLVVTGRCRGCTSDQFGSLFDQTTRSASRSLQGDGAGVVGTPVKEIFDRCFCPPTSENVAVTEDDLKQALSDLPFVNNGVTLEEVELVDCGDPEEITFNTTIVIDADVNDVTSVDAAWIGQTFIDEYNRLSGSYCDEFFRHPETATTQFQTLRQSDQTGMFRVIFFLKVEGRCRGCKDLFGNRRASGSGRRRRMQASTDSRCYCRKDAKNGAVDEEEFEANFRNMIASRRRNLQDQGAAPIIEILSVWQAPDVTLGDLAGSLLQSPNGYSQWKNCKVPDGKELRIGDGYCDRDIVENSDPPEYIYNVESCGWDGGDCCEFTCQDGISFKCGEESVFDCRSEQGSNSGSPLNEDFTDTTLCHTEIGDGWCDLNLNNEANNFDGGDCCPDTCNNTCFTCGSGGYFCYNPISSNSTSPPPEGCNAEETYWIGDGYCDEGTELNTKECNWDGGDCCPETCISTQQYECGVASEYYCRNETSPYRLKFVGRTYKITTACEAEIEAWDGYVAGKGMFEYPGDGFCDYEGPFNSAACDWDGGDCCPSTCNSTVYRCGRNGFVCEDPDVGKGLTLKVQPPVAGCPPGAGAASGSPGGYIEELSVKEYVEFPSSPFYTESPNDPPTVYISFWYMIYWCPGSKTWNFALNWNVYDIQYSCQTKGIIQSAVVDNPTTPCDANWTCPNSTSPFLVITCGTESSATGSSAGGAVFISESSQFLETMTDPLSSTLPSTKPTTTPRPSSETVQPTIESNTELSTLPSSHPTDVPTPLASNDPTPAPQLSTAEPQQIDVPSSHPTDVPTPLASNDPTPAPQLSTAEIASEENVPSSPPTNGPTPLSSDDPTLAPQF